MNRGNPKEFMLIFINGYFGTISKIYILRARNYKIIERQIKE